MFNTLKFITAGNVDDGKSTLIGRLLYDSDSIHTDQLGVLQKKAEDGEVDLSLITDGLRAEREQGITIDVAYKYFATEKRKFIIADAPGHEQYTRNMITGASSADLIIILVDARKGITTQTKRHASIGSLVGIKTAIVAVNKFDLVDYDRAIFEQIQQDFEALRAELDYQDVSYIPVSALNGANVVNKSEHTPWYNGTPLLQTLEEVQLNTTQNLAPRFQVQLVIRPKSDEYHDYRGYAGPVLSGSFSVGDAVTILPSGKQTVIKAIEIAQKQVQKVDTGRNTVIHLADEIDISRGDYIVLSENVPTTGKSLSSWIAWLNEEPLQLGKTYILRHRFKDARVKIQTINQKWDINHWQFEQAENIGLNDIAQISFKTDQTLAFDPYQQNSQTGNAILIDTTTNNTVGALMFL